MGNAGFFQLFFVVGSLWAGQCPHPPVITSLCKPFLLDMDWIYWLTSNKQNMIEVIDVNSDVKL